jgi:hypothetical protein
LCLGLVLWVYHEPYPAVSARAQSLRGTGVENMGSAAAALRLGALWMNLCTKSTTVNKLIMVAYCVLLRVLMVVVMALCSQNYCRFHRSFEH